MNPGLEWPITTELEQIPPIDYTQHCDATSNPVSAVYAHLDIEVGIEGLESADSANSHLALFNLSSAMRGVMLAIST
jgi:hypothetical protein